MKIDRICIRCDKKLSGDGGDDFDMPPSDGLFFTAYGNYGSTVFDPIQGGERLECYLCDDCVKANSDKVFHVRYFSRREQITKVQDVGQWFEEQHKQARAWEAQDRENKERLERIETLRDKYFKRE